MPSLDEQAAIIRESPLFDPAFYRETYPDVDLSEIEPAEHYLKIGGRLGRNPGPDFDAKAYLERYLDVARRGDNPLVHFETWGRGERRDPQPASAMRPDPARVDVVVPVFNALEDVTACLNSLARAKTRFDVRVLVVNDGSDKPTTRYLREACDRLGSERVRFELIEHETQQGYTVAVNSGLMASDAAYVATLNSDTIVTRAWLDGLVDAMSETVGITGPLSNAASWQNVPLLKDENGFAINILPDGVTPDDMAEIVRLVSRNARPLTPFLNGFCFLIRRDVLDAVGYMDEASFPLGYGEENDFCLRAQDAGFELAIADNVYVFHAKSKSFGHERRAELSKAGSRAARRKHGDGRFEEKLRVVANLTIMDVVRKRVARSLTNWNAVVPKNTLDWVGRQKVLFLLPVLGGSGGAHSVVQEATAMMQMGVDVAIAVSETDYPNFMTLYGDIEESGELFTKFRPETIVATAARYDVVVATIFSSITLLERIARACPWILPAYYVQDYEPMFFERGSDNWERACSSYTAIKNTLLFAKTDWICREVERKHGVEVRKVEPSIDHDVYSPPTDPLPVDRALRITAMIRPKTPRRGAKRTMELLAALKNRFGDEIEISIFGCDADKPDFRELPQEFDFSDHGVLTRPAVAELLRSSDMFIDLSDYQAFGRTALEAMACGVLAVVPRAGGGDEYAIHDINAMVVDSFDIATSQDLISEVLEDRTRLERIRMQGLSTASLYSPRRAALSELLAFAPALAERRSISPAPRRPRVALIPALRAGTPATITGSGYVRLLNPYRQDAVVKNWSVDFSEDGTLPEPGTAEVAMLQRDLSSEVSPHFASWSIAWKETGGKLIYEVDDDLRDAEALKDRGYSGNAQALRDRVSHYADAADLITVSTAHLAETFSEYSDKVVVVPNYIDRHCWRLDPSISRPTRPKHLDKLVVGYAGTPTHTADLEIVQDAIRHLEGQGRIRVEVVGAFQRTPPLFGKRIGLPKNNLYPYFSEWLKKIAKWDIAIVPLCDTEFNRSKSNLKFIETATLNAAILCSDMPEYGRVVRHGENGMLVNNTTEDWLAALTRVIDDHDLRYRLAHNAYQDVCQKLTVQANHDIYNQVLRQAAGLV